MILTLEITRDEALDLFISVVINYEDSPYYLDLRSDLSTSEKLLREGFVGFQNMSNEELSEVWATLFTHDDIDVDVETLHEFGCDRIKEELSERFFDVRENSEYTGIRVEVMDATNDTDKKWEQIKQEITDSGYEGSLELATQYKEQLLTTPERSQEFPVKLCTGYATGHELMQDSKEFFMVKVRSPIEVRIVKARPYTYIYLPTGKLSYAWEDEQGDRINHYKNSKTQDDSKEAVVCWWPVND